MKKILASLLFSLISWNLLAQMVPVGEWRVHIPYSNPFTLVDAGNKIYVGNELSVYAVDKVENFTTRYSKINGLSDIGVRNLFYDESKQSVIILYSNSNIDILKLDQIINFRSIKEEDIAGDKAVYHASFKGDSIFLSCGFGIVVLNSERYDSPATYFFIDEDDNSIRVNATAAFGSFLYAATSEGLYRGSLSNPLLEDFAGWELVSGNSGLPAGEVSGLAVYRNELIATVGDTLFKHDGADWMMYYFEDGWKIRSAYSQYNYLNICQWYADLDAPDSVRILILDPDEGSEFIRKDDFFQRPVRSVVDLSGIVWTADLFKGLLKVEGEVYDAFNPDGPSTSKVFNIASSNDKVFVAPGEVNDSWNVQFNRDGFFEFSSEDWKSYNSFVFPQLDTILDFLTVAIDPASQDVYLGSYGGGLMKFSDSGNEYYKQNSSLQGAVGNESAYRVSGLAFDLQGNLWISNHGAPSPISVLKPDGTWKAFNPGLNASIGNQLSQIIIDEFDKKWIVLPRGNGILVYDHGDDIDNAADDDSKRLGLGVGNGNLHTTDVNCLALDLDGEVWVGTDEGITVFFNPFDALSGSSLGDASQIFVELDGFGGFLLESEVVNALAVDGANRKWIGTDNGVFLVSSDGSDQLEYFNTDNSPLLSNIIRTIAINQETGEVFIGTESGIISYRGTATGGTQIHSNVKVFPNPVKHDYQGPVSISGLAADADVSITDISGNVIYKTIALGGQVVWDGNNTDGRRARTGVYLVMSSNEDGTDTFVTKFVIIN